MVNITCLIDQHSLWKYEWHTQIIKIQMNTVEIVLSLSIVHIFHDIWTVDNKQHSNPISNTNWPNNLTLNWQQQCAPTNLANKW